MKNIYKWGAVAFGVTLVSTFVYGQARTPYTRPAYITTPGSVSTSASGDQFVCTNTTAVCEVESSINATTMTSTVPAFDIGPTATPGTDDRLACFSYGATGSKTRMMCVDKEGDVSATTMALGTTPVGIRAHFLTEATAYTPSDFTSSHAVFGRSAASGASSGGVFFSYHTTDNEGMIGALSPGTAWRPLSFPASEWKFRQNGATLIANITSTGAYNSAAASGNQAFTCTNAGCRLSLGNTARYLRDDGAQLEVVSALNVTSSIKAGSTLSRGTITLSSGTGTATVLSGAVCACSRTDSATAVQCNVATTTLTATSGASTGTVAYVCL